MSEWLTEPLNQLAAFQKGRKVETSEHPRAGFEPYLGASAISGVIEEYGDARFGVMASNNDVLMLWDGERSGLVGKAQKGVISSTVSRLTPKGDVDGSFLYYALDAKFDWIQGRRTGTGVPHVPKDLGRILLISYPKDKNEQNDITEILSTLDDQIKRTETLIAKYQQIKAGLMQDLFTRGMTADGRLRPERKHAPNLYKESALGWIPKEWDTKLIQEIGKVKGGKRLPAGTPFASSPTPFPYLRVTDMVDGWIDDSALEYIDTFTEKLISSYKIFQNDIYVTIAGTLGQFGRIPVHLNGSQLTENAARIAEVNLAETNLDFLCSVLRSDFLNDQKFAAMGIGAGVPKLALYQIERLRVPYPKPSEQAAIQKPLTVIQNAIKENRSVLKKLRDKKKGLMQDLLTGRVRVKVTGGN